MEDDVCVTLEIDDEGRGHLRFELPPGTPEDEIAYFQSLVVCERLGSIELVDPATREVIYFLRPTVLH